MKFSTTKASDRVILALVGDIDETLQRSVKEIVAAITPPLVEMDCAGIEKISSIGVRVWASLLESIPPGVQIVFSNCSDIFINYVNLIAGMIGRGTVSSLRLGYECGNCGTAKTVTFPLAGVHRDDLAKFPAVPCDRCQKPVECRAEPDEHLSFLA